MARKPRKAGERVTPGGGISGRATEKMLARNMYVGGASVDEIALRLGKGRATIYRWYSVDRANGRDWERYRLQQVMDSEEQESRHRNFLNQIFACFEADMPEISTCKDAKTRLEWLDRYSNAYYKLMNAAKREMPQVGIAEIAGKTLDVLVSIASDLGDRVVLEWVVAHLDDIRDRVAKEVA